MPMLKGWDLGVLLEKLGGGMKSPSQNPYSINFMT